MKKTILHKSLSIDFDLRQLEIFCKIVELKSFSKAASKVYLAQASVSERIATLESMVGTRLLDRLGRQVVPTKAGELFYKHAVQLLDMKRKISLEMQDFLGLKYGEIQLGGSTIPGEYILPAAIERFRKKNPDISISLTVSDSSAIERLVLEGAIELGVVGAISFHKNLINHKLWEDELLLAVPVGHKWAKKKEVAIEDLATEPFILRESGSGTLKIIADYFRKHGSNVEDSLYVVARLGTSTAVKEGIKAGLGVSILSSKAIDTELKTGVIKALKVKHTPMIRNFYLIRDKRRTASPLCRTMFDFLLTE